MAKITVLPHETVCPEGKTINDVPEGSNLCQVLLDNGVEIEHACEMSCACSTCHVILREGFDSLQQPDLDEEDMLDRAWGLEAQSRLSCQVVVGNEDLVVDIPRYTVNHARENG